MVIAKTLDGDLGILTGHPPVLGILADASLVRILDAEDGDGRATAARCAAAVSSGFLSVADDRVSILARQAELGSQVEVGAARARLDTALSEAGQLPPGEAEPTRGEIRPRACCGPRATSPDERQQPGRG